MKFFASVCKSELPDHAKIVELITACHTKVAENLEYQVSSLNIVQLVKALETNRTISQINLSYNNITDNGAITLVGLLESNNKITSKIIIDFTDFENAKISYQVEELLIETLESHNKKLEV
ncbi:hypothetical protein [Candidatus Tisiphia endosymbiont of Myopa tessellatipennis]|uniref:hypothetical protein n=1 Tax=Candidatus Tisiphia endosymbiont of Myopa tessellatipennis TaxID=3066257 RepID=UPI00313A8D98